MTSLPRLLALSISLALVSACGGSAPPPAGDAKPSTAGAKGAEAPVDEHALAMDIAATLQACSYDGAPVQVKPALGKQPPTDCRDMVAQVMNFTGLPQNFDVIEADVPNAAAVILLDENKLPHRVIAFNPDFIDVVRRATDQNNWGPVSIMAHEIGHHLSGHTIMPGGSQPPTELEADKFSGFVLYKMGAQLVDAQRAMMALVPEQGGDTHPGRGKRLAAIAEGWQQACKQQGGTCTAQTRNTTPVALPRPAATQSPVTDIPAPRPVATTPAPVAPPSTDTLASAGDPSGGACADVLPLPDANATPMKFGKFVVDEFGMLDPTIRAQHETRLREHARTHGVEIVTLLVRDLHGLSADAYAHAMLRQLRVGKLDVGNGAVLVVAPGQSQVGVAMGPGVKLEMRFASPAQSLTRWLQSGWPECKRKNACNAWTDNLLGVADHIRRDTDDWDWTIRHQSMKALVDADAADVRARADGGPRTSLVDMRPIARFNGTVVALSPPPGKAGDSARAKPDSQGYRTLHVRSPEGYTVMLHVHPDTEALMPGGRLAVGSTYSFVGRAKALSWNIKDAQSLYALSYDKR